MKRSTIGLCLLLLLFTGCQSRLKEELGVDATRYEALYPLYAELCAASQFKKRPGIPPAIEGGGFGGHSVLYLSGVCRVEGAGYPVLALCGKTATDNGAGLSVNAHYKNANWVATEGRAFFFGGLLKKGEALTGEAYEGTVRHAQAMNIYDGIQFHEEVYDERPAGMSKRDYMYKVSLGTDFALAYARDVYCARVPLTRSQMGRAITYLNAVNEPYRSGAKRYRWDVLKDNCNHLIHNALAAAGVWEPWPANRTLVVSALSFPVPKNEFVNLMQRTNDAPLDDPVALFQDETLRKALLDDDWMATAPGGLAVLRRMVTDNRIYDPDVQLVFWDEPLIGAYPRRYRRIRTEARYSDPDANLRYFAGLYRTIQAARKPLSWHLERHANWSLARKDEFSDFYVRYYDYIGRQSAKLDKLLADPLNR